jgi:dihydroorotase
MTAYDLLITGGTVIDPASGLHDRRDVGIADGRIVAVAAGLSTSDARDVVDATDRLVVPGLVDLHVHVYAGVADLSVEADPTCLGRGVTTVVDAGSSGANTFPGFRRHVVEASRGRVLAYLNISATGQIDPFLGELHDLRFADPDRAAAVARAHPDVVVGFKVRVSEMLAGPNGLAGLDRALEAGRATGLPVMVHIGGTAFDIEEALDRLRPDDVVTHAYTGWNPGGILTDSGRVVAAAREARTRGVRFDVGHGAGSFTWRTAEAALADGFRPDTISSDLHRFNIAGPVHDLATTLSKFLLLGLSIDDVVAMATTAPAAALGPTGAGLASLAVGAAADVTILGLEDGRFDLVDSAGTSRSARQRLVPVATVRAGETVPVLPLVTTPPVGISPG